MIVLAWLFGLFASGAFGVMFGYALTDSPTGILLGCAGGVAAFVCVRLFAAK